MSLSVDQCQKARLSRDARFDGKFYIAVKTTGIYCRPICPAPAPKEQNVVYYATAIEAANEGFRPCLRCRPDSAPGSFAWKGVDTTVERALKLIGEGALANGSVEDLADRLGVSGRYLRSLFQEKVGTAPKQYALYQQLLFAKQLLFESALPVTEVAFAAGFNSVRRFNDSFKQHFNLTPGQVRKQQKSATEYIELTLSYRPPYRWDLMQGFLTKRLIPSLEWIEGDCYGRTFDWFDGQSKGYFEATHLADKNAFRVKLFCDQRSNLLSLIKNIRRILDLDTDIAQIEAQLAQLPGMSEKLVSGLRLPGIWSPFEAGIRAILGQQISVEAARKLVAQVVDNYGEPMGDKKLFPTAQSLAETDFAVLRMPQSRKNTLMAFSRYCADNPQQDDLDQWLAIKGIGPWTVNYAKMRGQSDSDIWLASDLGVKKALAAITDAKTVDFEQAKPWRSYLTFQCWSML